MRTIILMLILGNVALADYEPKWKTSHPHLHKFKVPAKCKCDKSGQPVRCHPGIVCEKKK